MHQLIIAICFLLFMQCQAQEPIGCVAIKCDIFCPYGHIRDNNGCSTCKCFDPCQSDPCPSGQRCEVESLMCIWQPCGYVKKCVPCPLPLCVRTCPFGYQLDKYGCQTCDCIDPCRFHICSKNEYCVTEPVSCNNDPFCGVRVKCVKKCPEILCDIYCPYGYKLDCNNCQTCNCIDPCQDVICPKYHYCVVNVFICKKPPCPGPKAFCKHYCDNNELLLRDTAPVTCNSGVINSCGPNYTCNTVNELSISFCCGKVSS